MLQKNCIFFEEDWKLFSLETFQRFNYAAETIMSSARKMYCGYSLYQSICQSPPPPNNIRASGLSNTRLQFISDREGFNRTAFMQAIGQWMWNYSISGLRNCVNTIYIVGDSGTDAETFCAALTQLFHCVLTADIKKLDMASFSDTADEVKMIYFPSACGQPQFKNPLVNSLLCGRELTVMNKEGKLRKISPLKCLVHLNNMPPLNSLPTSKEQHFIFWFKKPSTGYCFFLREIKRYLVALIDENQDDIRCMNDYGVLCSRYTSDIVCTNCAKPDIFLRD